MPDIDEAISHAEPVDYQFQCRDGKWYGFMNEQHRLNTIADGTWPIRPLYAEPQPDRVAELERELETERMRLSACGTAALGYYDGCADEYRSASLDDVLRLRAEVERLRTLLSEAIRARDEKEV